jgi:predicted RNase H-like HicB family nuclease
LGNRRGWTVDNKFQIHFEDEVYVAQSLIVDIASEGSSYEEAAANLEEALSLYFESLPVMPTTIL